MDMIEELESGLNELWIDYLVFRDGCSTEKAMNLLDVDLESLDGVEKELDYIRVEFDNMADNEELSKKFYDRFDFYWNELNYLKTDYMKGKI